MEDEEMGESGWRKGKDIQILYMSMGQGDCCVITCPDGKHVVIDCGTKGKETWDSLLDICSLIRSVSVLRNPKAATGEIEALILTHPDKDHINQVKGILGSSTFTILLDTKEEDDALDNLLAQADPKSYKVTKSRPDNKYLNKIVFEGLKVNNVYFADPKVNDRDSLKRSPLLYYYASGCSKALYNQLSTKKLYCVTLNSTEKTLHSWKRPYKKEENYSKESISTASYTLLSGKKPDWEVSLVAGNVKREKEDKSDTDGKNAASLVTLIKIGKEKILICGDATLSTENYLRKTFSTELKDLDLIQAGHHGSSVTSSTKDFVDTVKAKRVMISVQEREHSHHLPGKDTLARYTAHAKKESTAHRSCYWERIEKDEIDSLAEAWEKLKQESKIDYRVEGGGYRYTLTKVSGTSLDKHEGYIVLDGFRNPSDGWGLMQKQVKENIKQTGIDQHLWYFFDGTPSE
jgi:beta-lactamase superfamily II metal-dependent hydrolase